MAVDIVTEIIIDRPLRNRGEPAGFGKLAAPLMAAAMRRANRKDLERLKAILEGRAAHG